MKKKKSVLLSVSLIIALTALYGMPNIHTNPANDLTLSNVEALTSGETDGSVSINICSRKPGNNYCSATRGKRKWVLRIVIKPYNSSMAPNITCPDCPDDDWDYEEE